MTALVVFAGLPGTGKTTLGRALSRSTGAVLLRVDTIETAAASSLLDIPKDQKDLSYRIAAAQAREMLGLGQSVIIDCVNAIPLTRGWFTEIADESIRLVTVELHCSDPEPHRARVESRTPDLPGLTLPDWARVQGREYRPWTDAMLRIDTAETAPETAAALVSKAMNGA